MPQITSGNFSDFRPNLIKHIFYNARYGSLTHIPVELFRLRWLITMDKLRLSAPAVFDGCHIPATQSFEHFADL